MAFPTPIVEIAFDDSPYAVSPTWTTVTSYVRSMNVSRGRSDDWGDFDGSATVVLDNRDRRFDPFYTSGAYYGKLLPRRQIRIRAETVELGVTTTHDVFRGFVSGWAPEWTDGGKDSTVTLSCFDALQLLASEQLPSDWARDYILSLNPRHYYPCDEPISPFDATQRIKDYGTFPLDLIGSGNITSGSEIAGGLASTSVSSLSAVSTGYFPAIAATNFTVSFWAILGEGNVNGYMGTADWAIGSVGNFVVVIGDSGTVRTWTCSDVVDLATPHFYAFTYNTTTKAMELFVDGVVVGTSLTSTATATPTYERVGFTTGEFQQICVWTSILTQAQLQNIYNYSKAEFPESTSARFNRLIGETSFSLSLCSVPASPAGGVLNISNDAAYLTPELMKVAASEGGALFVSKNGTLTMFGQNQIRTQSSSLVSQVTYGDSGTAIGLEVQLSPDGDSMRNVVSVTMSGAGVYRKENTASVAAYGGAAMSIETQVRTLANAQTLADIATGWGGQVYPRLSPIEVVLSRDNLWAPTLALELLDRVTVNVKPPTGNTVSVPMLVQRISHDVVAGQWSTTLEGSARWAAVFKVGVSAIGGTDLLG